MRKLNEECGVFAVYGAPDAANVARFGLYELQHRGQESCGIASSSNLNLYRKAALGLVMDVFPGNPSSELPGDLAIGHTRYSTAGGCSAENAQPFKASLKQGQVAVAHNGTLAKIDELKNRLKREGVIFQSTSDTEVVLHLIARSSQPDLVKAIRETLQKLEGAFTLVFLTKDAIIGARDPYGFRPLALGQIPPHEGTPGYVLASETCAFKHCNAKYLYDVEPGEMVVINRAGIQRQTYAKPRAKTQCIFEHVYFARPDSLVYGRYVGESREYLGRLLAKAQPANAEVVVAVPDSGITIAEGYSLESGIPKRQGLTRSHYVGRSFIQPTPELREQIVKLKLTAVRYILEGKRVVLIDDSIVRGTTSRKIVRMVRAAGATEVHVRIACPPIRYPCFYGTDIPDRKLLIAANHTIGETCDYIEADSLGYLPTGSMLQACGGKRRGYCRACMTGRHPTLINLNSA